MKYKVLRTFRDKYTQEVISKDSEIDITEDRAKEILKVGKLIEAVEKPKKAKKKKED